MFIKVWNFFDKLIYIIMSFVYKLIGKKYNRDCHESWIQFVKFALVGVSNTVIYYIFYAGSLIIFRKFKLFPVWDYIISQTLGFIFGVLWAFCLNRKLVFKDDKGKIIEAIIKFYASYSFTGLLMNSVLLYIWKNIGISEFIGPIINLFFTTPVNYFLNKFWTFKK